VVIDRLQVQGVSTGRLSESVKIAMKMGGGNMMVQDADEKVVPFSRFLMDPISGLSYDEPQPNSFSFNSPYGACPNCEGMGETAEVNVEFIIPDRTKSINRGGIVPIGELRENWTFSQLRALSKVLDFSLADSISKLSEQQIGNPCKPSGTKKDIRKPIQRRSALHHRELFRIRGRQTTSVGRRVYAPKNL